MAVKTPAEIAEENKDVHSENIWLEMAELEPEIMFEATRPDHENQILEHATVIKDNRVVYVEFVVGLESEMIRRDYPDLSVEDVIALVKEWQTNVNQITD